MMYHLLDSRAGTISAKIQTNDLNLVDEDWERFILLTSNSKKEICHHANIGDYGDNCIVSEDSTVRWDWYTDDGKWVCKIN